MENNQISSLLTSYIKMDEVNDLSNSTVTSVRQFLEGQETPDAHLLSFTDKLDAENGLLTQSLFQERKLNDTKRVQELDGIRDNYCTTFYAIVKAHIGSPILEQAKAAEHIYQILKNNGGNPSRLSLEKQSAVMNSMFAAIDADGLESVETLYLTSLYNGMVKSQSNYKESELARSVNKAARDKAEPAGEVVKRVLNAFENVVNYLNLMNNLLADTYGSTAEVVDSLIDGINTKIRTRNTNAQKEEVQAASQN